MEFSERHGFKKPKLELQIDEIDEGLESGLWDALDMVAFVDISETYSVNYSNLFDTLTLRIWHSFFKKPIDTRPKYPEDAKREIRVFFFKSSFPEVYEFLEFVAKNLDKSDSFCLFCNRVLEREKAAFRFIGTEIAQVTNETEIAEIEKAQDQQDSKSVAAHIDAAVVLYSDRKKPDYRNSIKESISAVEAAAKELAGPEIKKIGDALKVLEQSGDLHAALKQGWSKLYGWTSDSNGVRHAIMDETNLTEADAKYMLVSCSAFANYLLSKKIN